MSNNTSYDHDIVAWANEQVNLLRAGRFSEIDIEHIAEEIEDVGKSEQRELASRMSLLLAHLLKWQYQQIRRGASWQRTIREQRDAIKFVLKETPSLKNSMKGEIWIKKTWADAVSKAADETGLDTFPETLPWSFDKILSQEFYPE